jgi:hypothetical protein
MFETSVSRVKCALFIVIAELASVITLYFAPYDDSYYLLCGAFNLAIVFGLRFIADNLLVNDLQKLNTLALCFQGAGFFFYWVEIPVWIYNYSIHLITLLQILRLIIVRKGDDDLFENHHLRFMVHNRNMLGDKRVHQEKT